MTDTSRLSRRANLALVASVPVVALPAAAVTANASDPIFAAIDRFVALQNQSREVCGKEPTTKSGRLASGTPEYLRWEMMNDACGDEATAALKDMIAIQP